MPGSEPPETSHNPGADARELAASIRENFAIVITALQGQMDLVFDPDSEAVRALWKAKSAAERGLELSQRLLKSIEGNGQRI